MPPEGSDEPEWPMDAVEVARIAGAWGVRGELKLQTFSTEPQALFSSKRWFLSPPEGAARAQASLPRQLLRVERAREHGDFVVAKVHDIDDRDAAAALSGWRVFVSRASFPTPQDDEYYWVDLIGSEVVDRQGRGLGCVTGLLETGPHCVLRLCADDAEGGERLIPFVAAYVDRVDLAARRIFVDWSSDY